MFGQSFFLFFFSTTDRHIGNGASWAALVVGQEDGNIELAEGKAQLINHATTGDLFHNPINYLQKKRRMKRVCDSDSRDNANGDCCCFIRHNTNNPSHHPYNSLVLPVYYFPGFPFFFIFMEFSIIYGLWMIGLLPAIAQAWSIHVTSAGLYPMRLTNVRGGAKAETRSVDLSPERRNTSFILWSYMNIRHIYLTTTYSTYGSIDNACTWTACCPNLATNLRYMYMYVCTYLPF
jgi:hypothetical protein